MGGSGAASHPAVSKYGNSERIMGVLAFPNEVPCVAHSAPPTLILPARPVLIVKALPAPRKAEVVPPQFRIPHLRTNAEQDMTSAPRVGQEDSMMATKAEAMSREPFGRWLIAQRDRGDWIDELANAARTDLAFPKDGDPEIGRAHV